MVMFIIYRKTFRKRYFWHYLSQRNQVSQENCGTEYKCKNRDGYMEGDKAVITWCVGHLVTMSYPDQYDLHWRNGLRNHSIIPVDTKYETIQRYKNSLISYLLLLNREDIDIDLRLHWLRTERIPSGRPAGQCQQKQEEKRVWIDSQTKWSAG